MNGRACKSASAVTRLLINEAKAEAVTNRQAHNLTVFAGLLTLVGDIGAIVFTVSTLGSPLFVLGLFLVISGFAIANDDGEFNFDKLKQCSIILQDGVLRIADGARPLLEIQMPSAGKVAQVLGANGKPFELSPKVAAFVQKALSDLPLEKIAGTFKDFQKSLKSP